MSPEEKGVAVRAVIALVILFLMLGLIPYGCGSESPSGKCYRAVELREMATGIPFKVRFVDGRCFMRTPGQTGQWTEIKP